MSTTPNFSDFFIDYMDNIWSSTVIDKYENYKPYKDTPNLIYSPSPETLLTVDGLSAVDTIVEVNRKILSANKGDITLDKEEVYDVISRLSIEDLSLFSPNIEIYRRLPAFLSADEESVSNTGFIYKKLDFVDGWNSSLGKNDYDSNISKDKQNDILQGITGVGLASILDASWQIQGASKGLETGVEIYDYLSKIAATVSGFDINFRFDSVATFFGNAQSNNDQLITNFFRNPKENIKEMIARRIEGNEITRNYAYLMFFGDIKDYNKDNTLKPENNEEAYTFLIKVGYNPLHYSVEDVIADPEKKERIKKFNQFLIKSPDYFNLIFDAYLGEYAFQFQNDNSIKLKCSFLGNVRQGAINEINAHRRPEFNFLTVLEELALKEEQATNADIAADIQRAKEIVSSNQNLIDEFDNLYKAGCIPEQGMLDTGLLTGGPGGGSKFRQSLVEELDESSKLISNIQQKSWSLFLDDVPIHNIFVYGGGFADTSATRNTFENWKESVLNPSSELNPSFNYVTLETLPPTNIATQKKELDTLITPDKAKEAASTNASTTELRSTQGSTTQRTCIPFFFFGDLVDATIQKFKNHHNREGSKTKNSYDDIFATIPFIKVDKRSFKLSNNGGRLSYGIRNTKLWASRVPISIFIFRAWIYKNIIAKQRRYYHLFDLLNDFKTLLTEAINYKTPEIIENETILKVLKGLPISYSTFFQTSFEVQKDKPTDQVIKVINLGYNTPVLSYEGTPIPPQKFFSSVEIPQFSEKDKTKKIWICGYTGQTLFVNSSELHEIYEAKVDDSESSTMKATSAGDYSKDMKLGIVHFFIGNQLGLAKTFSFNSGPAPNQKEIQTTNETRINEIRNIRYDDVEIKMVGGNFFRPTEIIYIHPHHTFGEPYDAGLTMSNILNIGGYYQILEINGNFSSSGVYETTMKAKYLVQVQAVGEKPCEVATNALKIKFEQYKTRPESK
jgi:hypothetical protein